MAEFDMGSIKPNSYTYKKQEEKVDRKKIKPVVSKDDVVTTKKPLGKRIVNLFIGDDVQDIKKYIFMDVIIPGIQNTILDMLNMAFFGETRRSYSRGSDKKPYNSYYKGSFYSSNRRDKERDRGRGYEDSREVDYRNIVLRNREDAERVVDVMREKIHDEGMASIADLLDLIDVSSRYTDNNWGWTDERDIGIRRISSGFLINVAEARYLD